jgi:hypothetical protein
VGQGFTAARRSSLRFKAASGRAGGRRLNGGGEAAPCEIGVAQTSQRRIRLDTMAFISNAASGSWPHPVQRNPRRRRLIFVPRRIWPSSGHREEGKKLPAAVGRTGHLHPADCLAPQCRPPAGPMPRGVAGPDGGSGFPGHHSRRARRHLVGQFVFRAVKKFPRAFNSLFISMVEAGEASGALAEILARWRAISSRRSS